MSRCILLIVDDRKLVLRSLKRALERKEQFDEVYVADSPESGELLLREKAVTHLLCDYNLGAFNGAHLVNVWRERYPGIERAVIISGEILDNGPAVSIMGVDAVAPKTVSPDILVDKLKGDLV
jgi:DNA-binding NarL/FixJ family response regulator